MMTTKIVARYTVLKGYTRYYTDNRARGSPELVGRQFVRGPS